MFKSLYISLKNWLKLKSFAWSEEPFDVVPYTVIYIYRNSSVIVNDEFNGTRVHSFRPARNAELDAVSLSGSGFRPCRKPSSCDESSFPSSAWIVPIEVGVTGGTCPEFYMVGVLGSGGSDDVHKKWGGQMEKWGSIVTPNNSSPDSATRSFPPYCIVSIIHS